MLKYIFTSLSLLLATLSFAQTDSTAKADSTSDKKPVVKMHVGHQLRFSYDISQPIINSFVNTRQSQEFQIDYYVKKEMYAVVEGGWGSANDNYTDLSYKSSNSFFRIGFDKCVLQRLFPGDWDMAFIGLRYGIASINRGDATYTTHDTLWGNTLGAVPSASSVAQWVEITGGVKVELVKGIYAGWNIRGKFLMNKGSFAALPPSFISGYGKGEKNSIFDFNFYISYAIRWKEKTTKSQK